jgi:hypothetical protein
MFRKEHDGGLICELVPHPVDKGTCILPYANDTIVLFKDSFDMAIDVKILL